MKMRVKLDPLFNSERETVKVTLPADLKQAKPTIELFRGVSIPQLQKELSEGRIRKGKTGIAAGITSDYVQAAPYSGALQNDFAAVIRFNRKMNKEVQPVRYKVKWLMKHPDVLWQVYQKPEPEDYKDKKFRRMIASGILHGNIKNEAEWFKKGNIPIRGRIKEIRLFAVPEKMNVKYPEIQIGREIQRRLGIPVKVLPFSQEKERLDVAVPIKKPKPILNLFDGTEE